MILVDKSGTLTPNGDYQFKTWFFENHHLGQSGQEDTAIVYPDDLVEGFKAIGDISKANPADLLSIAARFHGVKIVRSEDGSPAYLSGVRRKDELGLVFSGDTDEAPLEWIVDGFVPAGAVVMCVAEPDTLKTWFLMSLLSAVANKSPTWLGRNVRTEHYHADFGPLNPAAFMDFEQGSAETTRRLGHAACGLQSLSSLGRRSHPACSLGDARPWQALRNTHNRVAVLGVDSLSRCFPGVDEKDQRFAEPLAHAGRLAEDMGTTTIFTHHAPKSGGRTLSDAIRGTSALGAAADVVFYFERLPAPPGESRSKIRCLKMRRGGQKPTPFVIRLTDTRGLEIVDDKVKASDASDLKEEVFAYVRGHPGCSASNVAAALHRQKAAVLAAKRDLGPRLRVEGHGVKSSLFAVTESVPENREM